MNFIWFRDGRILIPWVMFEKNILSRLTEPIDDSAQCKRVFCCEQFIDVDISGKFQRWSASNECAIASLCDTVFVRVTLIRITQEFFPCFQSFLQWNILFPRWILSIFFVFNCKTRSSLIVSSEPKTFSISSFNWNRLHLGWSKSIRERSSREKVVQTWSLLMSYAYSARMRQKTINRGKENDHIDH